MNSSVLWQGDFYRLNSFSLVNNNLVSAIQSLGIDIHLAPTDKFQDIDLENIPDIFVFHNYPYDVIQAPGRFNIFYFPYEFFEFYDRDYFLAAGINNKFDLVVVPSNFSKDACIRSGVTIPIKVIAEGYKKEEFKPSIPPIKLATKKSFKFINMGGAFDRKGHDILVKAYLEEFSAEDDVVLVLKAFSYEQSIPWIEEIISKKDSMQSPPEILFEHQNLDSISGYYTASDVGVYPYRGEGFGLTILETIACGRKVIVTSGGSTDDFCSENNAEFISAHMQTTDGKIHLEPDYSQLRQLMRTQFELGKPSTKSIQKVSASVESFDWGNAARRWQQLFEEIESRKNNKDNKPKKVVEVITVFNDFDDEISPWKEYSPHTENKESISPWKTSSAEISEEFSKEFLSTLRIKYSTPFDSDIYTSKIIGEAGLSLEYFLAAKKQNPDTNISLFHEIYPIEKSMEIEHREREYCGIDYKSFPRYQSLLKWRYDKEIELADSIIVLDSATAEVFKKKYQNINPIVVSPPIRKSEFFPSINKNSINFLFWGFDPFRRGIRNLFEAWDSLNLQNAKLICLFETKLALSSKGILKHIINNSSIDIRYFDGRYSFESILEESDVQLIPSYGDGFFLPAANGLAMGKPAIVSKNCGLQDLVNEFKHSFITEVDSSESIKEGILYFSEMDKGKFNEIGRSISEHANKHTKIRFARELAMEINKS